MSSYKTDIEATGSKELIEKLKEQLKTDDNELLRAHILRLAQAWGLQVHLPVTGKVA
jgi:hypothetical protein